MGDLYSSNHRSTSLADEQQGLMPCGMHIHKIAHNAQACTTSKTKSRDVVIDLLLDPFDMRIGVQCDKEAMRSSAVAVTMGKLGY